MAQGVLVDLTTHKLAPASVQLDANGLPPSGYGVQTWYLDEHNTPINALTGTSMSPIAGVGQPTTTSPSGFASQQPVPTFGGGGDTPSWMPDWLQPQQPQSGAFDMPQANQPPGVTGGTITDKPLGTLAQQPKTTDWLSAWLNPQTLIPAATMIGGALIQKSAANNAVNAQTDASDKALALTKEMYDQDRADYAPYRNLGAFSVGQLGYLTGMPSDFGSQAVDQATQPQSAAPSASATHPSIWTALTDSDPTTHPQTGTAPAAPELQTLRDLGATRQTASSFVRMKAPNGEEADIHPSEVGLFEAQGARRVG